MLGDRDYMRADYEPPSQNRFRLGGRWSLTIWLIVINAAVFAVQLLFRLVTAGGGRPALELETWFALHPQAVVHGAVWQLLTFQFLHGGLMHILLNCLMLYWFGSVIENNFGPRRMLGLYLGSGVIGGLVQMALSLLFPWHFGMASVVGASAGVFGLVAAFAILFRNTPITMLVAFIFPVAMKAKYLLLIEVVMAAYGLIAANDNMADGIAHGAHLGGMLAGVLWALYIERGVNFLPRRPARPASRFHALEMVGTRSRTGSVSGGTARGAAAEDLPKEQFLAQEVDPILDKISAHGIQSLTEREKRILEAAKRKMEGR